MLTLDRLRAQGVLASIPGLTSPFDLADKIIGPALERIGFGWQEGRVSLSQLYMSGRICEELIEEILPAESANQPNQTKLAIVSLLDHHALGKRVIYAALRAAGYNLQDYGRADVYELVDRVLAEHVEVLLISATVQTSAQRVKEVRKRLDFARAKVKIIVGGAPFRFDTYLWQDVGADAMGFDAADTLKVVARVLADM
ncbi:MAG: trimethylamine corrinoid protein [Chloroflexota bacterium]|nr:trimethylamine corrinoid protein [Chloroflexota bacterium]